MDLIVSVLSDSKYYLERLYNKASQELSDKRSDKSEKLAELFDLLFEYVKDNKFERLKEPSAYDPTCKKLYPEQNASGKMQKASQELSDKGEKLTELFDLLFEYVKDNKFERLKEPSAYDSTCKKLYPEQNTSGKIQRVVLIGYTYDKKTTYCTIVDMGS